MRLSNFTLLSWSKNHQHVFIQVKLIISQVSLFVRSCNFCVLNTIINHSLQWLEVATVFFTKISHTLFILKVDSEMLILLYLHQVFACNYFKEYHFNVSFIFIDWYCNDNSTFNCPFNKTQIIRKGKCVIILPLMIPFNFTQIPRFSLQSGFMHQ